MSAHRIVAVTDEDGVLRADCGCGIGIYARIGGFTELDDKVGRHFHLAVERGQTVIWPEVDIPTNTVIWPEVKIRSRAAKVTDKLECPSCGDTYVHIDVVEARTASGRGASLTASGEDDLATVSATHEVDLAKDSGRRHSFSLVVWCEQCNAVNRLTFRQHKGETFVTYRADS